MKYKKPVSLAAIAVMFLLGIVLLTGGILPFNSENPQSLNAAQFSDSQAPEFELKNLDGETIKLSDYKGKVVLLNFWATWCGPCRVEIPDFVELMETKDTDKFVIIGLAVQSGSPEQIKKFADNMNMNYPILTGDNNSVMKIAQQYGNVQAIPTTFLIDQEGKIQNSYVGPRSAEVFWGDIESLL